MQPQPHVFQQHSGAMSQPMVPPQQGMQQPASMQYRKRPSDVDTLSKHIKFVLYQCTNILDLTVLFLLERRDPLIKICHQK